MHMADALLAPAVAATMYVASGVATGVSVKELKKDENMAKLPTMAVTAALVFAGQMINYTIPGTGSSGHLCGGMMLTALLGPYAGFLSMVVILTIQALFFADGGLLALGANCWNMAFYGCFIGYFLIWRPIVKNHLLKGEKRADRVRITVASVLGCVLTLQMGAFSVVLETTASGITELPFGAFAGIMQPIHLAIGLVEGLITTAVLLFVYEARPELLAAAGTSQTENRSGFSLKKTLLVLALLTVVTGGVFSYFASENPDGLEWSMFGNAEAGYHTNMGLDEEDYGITNQISEAAEALQEHTAFLPDYRFRSGEHAAGTAVSGLVGSAIVAGVAVLICMMGGFFRRKKQNC